MAKSAPAASASAGRRREAKSAAPPQAPPARAIWSVRTWSEESRKAGSSASSATPSAASCQRPRAARRKLRDPDGEPGEEDRGDGDPEQARAADHLDFVAAVRHEGEQQRHCKAGAAPRLEDARRLRDIGEVEQSELVPVHAGREGRRRAAAGGVRDDSRS